MDIIVKNTNSSLQNSLTCLRLLGFWPPEGLSATKTKIYNVYAVFCFMFTIGNLAISQVGSMVQAWSDVSAMTDIAYFLLTNFNHMIKLFNLMVRRRAILAIVEEADQDLKNECNEQGREIIKKCNRSTSLFSMALLSSAAVTILGLSLNFDTSHLPLDVWFPYDVYKSPAYELTYLYQILSLPAVAAFNLLGLDTLVLSLTGICCCRLRLVRLSLKELCEGLPMSTENDSEQQEIEAEIHARLHRCVLRHQAVLAAAMELRAIFSLPMLCQVTISAVIICFTAYQIAFEHASLMRLVGMVGFLYCMVWEVFTFCYYGNELALESTAVSVAAYQTEWYRLSASTRRSLLLMMTRSGRPSSLTAGGFTSLSLGSFASILKVSYSYFTFLKQSQQE